MEHFKKLSVISFKDKIAVKEINANTKLSYVSWAHAWKATKEIYPEAQYKILKFEHNLPYVYDNDTGYMVFTEVTIEGVTHEMFLPVMDSANNALKNHEYIIKTKYSEKRIKAADMHDINRTIMRCLTKNLAMFGLGLDIYAGDDIPGDETTTPQDNQNNNKDLSKPTEEEKQRQELITNINTLAILKKDALDKDKDAFLIECKEKGFKGMTLETLIKIKKVLAEL